MMNSDLALSQMIKGTVVLSLGKNSAIDSSSDASPVKAPIVVFRVEETEGTICTAGNHSGVVYVPLRTDAVPIIDALVVGEDTLSFQIEGNDEDGSVHSFGDWSLRVQWLRYDGTGDTQRKLPPSQLYQHNCLQFRVKSPNTAVLALLKSCDVEPFSCESLDLRSNVLGPRGTCALLTSLGSFTALRELYLDGCGVDDVSMACLHDLARNTSSLSTISLCHNNLCEGAGSTVLRLARCCRHIYTIHVEAGNLLSSYLLKRLENALAFNRAVSAQDRCNVFSCAYGHLTDTSGLSHEAMILMYAARPMILKDCEASQDLFGSLVVLAINAVESRSWETVKYGIVNAGAQWCARGVRRQGVLDAVAAFHKQQMRRSTEGSNCAAVVEQYERIFLEVCALVARTMYPQYIE